MFDTARIKLTVWYTLTIMLISLSFSAVVYQVLDREMERFARVQRFRVEQRIPGILLPPPVDFELQNEIRGRLAAALGLVNLGILAAAGLSGYLLAGRTLSPIQEMVEEQNRFVSDASHELRTPLTSLKSAIEVYLRDKKATMADSRKLAGESLEEINKMQSLSDAMLQLAQFQKPRRKPNLTEIEIPELIDRAVTKIMPVAKQRKVTIKTRINTETVCGDRFELQDLLVILLDNAVKYSREGGTVKIGADKEDAQVKIAVSDEGIGIEEKDLPHVFERFYRADGARTKTDAGGYGLGLSIAQKIAQEHRGRIELKSEYKKGSTFTVVLPSGPGKKIKFS